MTRALACALLFASACSTSDPCAGRSGACIGLTVEGSVGPLEQLAIEVLDHDTGASSRQTTPTTPSRSFDLPVTTAVLLGATWSGELTLEVTGLRGDGSFAGSGTTKPVTVAGDEHEDVSVTLTGASPGPDGGDTCADATQDGDETGIDCGGSCPLACIGAACTSASACVSGACDVVCVPASGPPGWVAGPSLTTPRGYVQGAQRTDGALVVVGGSSSGSPSDALASVDVLTRTGFVAGPNLTSARFGHAVASDAAGRVYAIAGRGVDNGALLSVEVLSGGSWTKVAQTTGTHSQFAAARVDSDRIVLTDNVANEVYAVSANTWSAFGNSTINREASADVFVPNVGMFQVGGAADAVTTLPNVDSYDGATGAWTSRAPLSVARGSLAGVLAGDGRIYAIGGLTATTTLATVEAYWPAANRWTSLVAQLPMARQSMAAGLGPDGRIYVTGGVDANGNPLATTLAYGPLVTVAPASASPGTQVTVTLSNLAASAATSITFDSTRVGVTHSDASGAATLVFAVPAGAASGTHTIEAVDARSQFPVNAVLTVP